MRARLFDRLAATASMLILVGLGMASYYFAKQAENQAYRAPAQAGRPDPDYFVERMALMRADASGAPSVRVEAERMLHYPLTRQITFTRPIIMTLDEQQPLLTISAQRGLATDSGDEANLYGDVRVLRAATAHEPAMQVDTQAARIDLVQKTVSTDQPVDIIAGDNRLRGVGLEIREHSRQLELRSRVQGHFPARTRPPGASRPHKAG